MKVKYRYIVIHTERLVNDEKEEFMHFIDTHNLIKEFEGLLVHLKYFSGQRIVKIENSSSQMTNW